MADGRLGLAVGDVSGHGFSAALIMAETRAYLRSLARTLRAIRTTRERAHVPPGEVALVGFADSATLACALALRRPVEFVGAVAVGPTVAALPAGAALNPSRVPRIAILCTKGEAGFERCRAAARLLEGVGADVDCRVLSPGEASAGLDRLEEALNFALRGLRMGGRC